LTQIRHVNAAPVRRDGLPSVGTDWMICVARGTLETPLALTSTIRVGSIADSFCLSSYFQGPVRFVA
jgi:hypothetical protein